MTIVLNVPMSPVTRKLQVVNFTQYIPPAVAVVGDLIGGWLARGGVALIVDWLKAGSLQLHL